MSTSPIVYRTLTFPLDRKIDLPVDMHSHQVDDVSVFVSPAKASYVALDDQESEVLQSLAADRTIGETIAVLESTHAPTAVTTPRDLVRSVLAKLAHAGFYEHTIPVEDTDIDFPVLCYLTRFCNLRCTHCYADAGPSQILQDGLTSDQWKKALLQYIRFTQDKLGKPPRVTFSGGEPLTRKDFFEIATWARNHGARTELFTNGTLLRDIRTVEHVKACIDSIQLSLDGATETVNDAIRGAGVFKKVTASLKLLMESGITTRLAVTVMPSNYIDLKHNLVNLLRTLDVPPIPLRLSLAMPLGRASKDVRFIDSVAGEEALRSILKPVCEANLRTPRSVTPNYKGVSCGFGRSLTIGSSGLVYGCSVESFPIGNVLTEPVSDIAERVIKSGKDLEIKNIDGCNSCDLRYFCYGVCRLNNITSCGSFAVCCTPKNKTELLRKLIARQRSGPSPIAESTVIGSFWSVS